MGLLRFSEFSIIPTFRDRARLRTIQKEQSDTLIPKTTTERIIEDGVFTPIDFEGVNENTTIFTVPENQVYYITALGILGVSTNGFKAILRNNNEVLIGNFGSVTSNYNNYPMPLKLNAGETLTISVTGAGNDAFALVQGYLIDVIKEGQKF